MAVVLAAEAVRNVLKELAAEAGVAPAPAFCEGLARRFDEVLSIQPYRPDRLIEVGPFVKERSGQQRSLVEMLVIEPGDDLRRTARLLLRTLDWQPVAEPRAAGKAAKR